MKLTSQETLKALIKQRRLSYNDIGEMSGCHRSMISQLVNGHRKSCTPDLAENIARSLGVPREVLFVDRTSATGGRDERQERIPA
jgi:transcriptional regulator with XRE-family HTH domain